MKLAINCSGGFAGDMFIASLISAGADFEKIGAKMKFAGNMLGRTEIGYSVLDDGSTRLKINLNSKHDTLKADEGRKILEQTFFKFKVKETYRKLGNKILETLLEAEYEVHKNEVFKFKNAEYLIPGGESGVSNDSETHLHEAQDIVIDIIGVISGMELLNISPEVALLTPVSVGDGKIEFSHGILNVPAPATKFILNKSEIDWIKGPVKTELCTPTGAAILSSLHREGNIDFTEESISAVRGQSRGTKDLPINPLRIFLY